jgi:hypothetical protein
MTQQVVSLAQPTALVAPPRLLLAQRGYRVFAAGRSAKKRARSSTP